jgi:hypothetical protein
MNEVIQFIKDIDYVAVFAAVLALHAGALAIVNLTPTPKDDEFVKKFYRVIEAFAGIFSAKNVKK